MNKIKVGTVNYLNTKPLIYGLRRQPIADKIKLIEDYPANLAEMLIKNEIDIGLIPVAAIPKLSKYHIIGDYCIGTEGEVASVCLFSEVPVEEIKKVYLDYQSRSSAALLKWLMKESWGSDAELIEAKDESFRNEIKGTTAGLIIGDRALEQRRVSTFIYDLGLEWKKITGLPFVFAVWVSKNPMLEEFVKLFNEANAMGLGHLEEIIEEAPFENYDLKKYYTVNISYQLNDFKRSGLNRFLELIKNI